MPAPKRPTVVQLQRQCDKWNRANKVGTLVSYESIIGEGETHRGESASEAQILSGHSAVIWLEGKSGCVMLDHCTAVAAETVPVIKITFEDRGQDFTEWYVRDGIVIDCQPNQGKVWVGTKVTNSPALVPGSILSVIMKRGVETTLNYPAAVIEVLSAFDAEQVEGYGRGWADMMGIPHSDLGL